MLDIIAGTYEVIEKIGSGGGGNVYLARHIRLNKQVVLKADKRQLSTREELLRREVDVLKNLSHSNIPQVYDFFIEGETVYTAMDYIDGESLDRPLKRGETFSQVQVIKWAKQMLEALSYLHSPTHGEPPRGYVHSDIKPANIMLRPNGDICLIDFNIALAIGEKTVIGVSAGYASPEHYGYDYSFKSSSTVTSGDATVPIDKSIRRSPREKTSACQEQTILPDARSDIYSLGATLYHLLSGRRPAEDARKVIPLSGREVSPQLADIITKAMNPNPDLRFQTAEEMLHAFEHLRENDPRTRKLKRGRNIAAAVLSSLFIIGAACSFVGLKQMEGYQEAAKIEAEQAEEAERAAKEAEQLAKDTLAAVREGESAYSRGDIISAVELAGGAMSADTQYRSDAQRLLTDALGVYDLSDGLKPHRVVELPSETLKLAISPEGTRLAALYAFSLALIDTETGEILAELPTQPTAMSDIVFLNEDVFIYAGETGLTAADASTGKALWQGGPATTVALSGDGKLAAAVSAGQSSAEIYDTSSGEQVKTVSFNGRKQPVAAGGGILADANDGLLDLDHEGRFLAASFEDGGLFIYDLQSGKSHVLLDSSDYVHFEGGFHDHYFAFSAWDRSKGIFRIIDMEKMAWRVESGPGDRFWTSSDSTGIYLASGNTLVSIDPVTSKQTEIAYTASNIRSFVRDAEGNTLVSMDDGQYALFGPSTKLTDAGQRAGGCEFIQIAGQYAALASRENQDVQILRLESHEEAKLCDYDPSIPHNEARLSADGKTVMLFQFDSFVILSSDGSEICRANIPDGGTVYDTQFRREGGQSWLEVRYRDGYVREYSASDGSVLKEYQGEKPDESLEESFETSRYVITVPLHGAPVVESKETGEQCGELEQDSYLTYVTELGEYIITQYISAKGEPYGLLLNQELETLAYLPRLCDVTADGTLIFDDGVGHLRRSAIYSAEELTAFASAY